MGQPILSTAAADGQRATPESETHKSYYVPDNSSGGSIAVLGSDSVYSTVNRGQSGTWFLAWVSQRQNTLVFTDLAEEKGVRTDIQGSFPK